jgi:hypothetical protein
MRAENGIWDLYPVFDSQFLNSPTTIVLNILGAASK